MLARLWSLLSPRRKRQFVAIVGLTVVSAIAEVVSLGAVLPFLAVLTSPERVTQYRIISDLMRDFGIEPSDLVMILAASFAVAALLAGASRMLLLWTSTRVAYATGADLSSEVYRRTLYQPYPVHLARNSSELISGITGKVADTVNILNQLLTLLSSCVLLTFITIALFAIDPSVAGLAMLGFGGGYIVITVIGRRRLKANSQRIAQEHTQVVKALQEGLGGIRDVLLDGTQPIYCEVYRRADYALRRAQGDTIFASLSPRFLMEALGMLLIAGLAFGISRTAGGVHAALPVLGALALGAQRLLPVLQQGYSAWATVVGSQSSLAKTIELLQQSVPADASDPPPPPLSFKDSARFDDVSFHYSAQTPWVLEKFDLVIPKGIRMGFVGMTGSGKTTALDIFMGLLAPTAGKFLVDGEAIEGYRVRAWQRAIAHVPQSIFLADASIAENIAFGIPPDEIDMERVKRAASRAQIADFIERRLEGYAVRVGERGVRLSGGQRQRIGIARALYKCASVLVFDEATSALDTATEQSVMDAVESLDRELTVLMIAHRLTTVRRCDVIVELARGRVVSSGTFDELLKSSPTFRSMVRTVA
jgi:ATP-binding cassette subfamily B protein